MKHRTLGKTGWSVGAVGMGCWQLGGQWGEIGETQAVATVHAALDAGINLFDTADAYGMGASEVILGKALKGRRDGVYVVSKVGNWGRRYNDAPPFNSIYTIINCCHASLHRLGAETIDVYLCHLGRPEKPEIFLEAFEILKKAGKIRHFGISTNDLWAAQAMNAQGQCAVVEINYSILQRDEEAAQLPYCQENNVGVILRGPLAMGVLSGRFSPETRFDDSVRRHWNEEGPAREKFLAALSAVERLRFLERPGRTLAQAALQFTLAHPAVACPLPGMKSPEQARQCAAAADGELSDEEMARIAEISPPAR